MGTLLGELNVVFLEAVPISLPGRARVPGSATPESCQQDKPQSGHALLGPLAEMTTATWPPPNELPEVARTMFPVLEPQPSVVLKLALVPPE